MYLAKLYDEAHFVVADDEDETVCDCQIHDDFLVKELGFHNAVYYIEKFESSEDMNVCPTCAQYVRDNHDLSEEKYAELARSAHAAH